MRRDGHHFPMTGKESLEILTLPDCAFLSDNATCIRLNITGCQGKDCTFFQSTEDHVKSRTRWKLHLLSLDEAQQKKIAKKYYCGTMPWKE
jgi:hypothetical protein